MNNLSNILQMFSSESLKTNVNNANEIESRENVKFLLKNSQSYRYAVSLLEQNKDKDHFANLYRSSQALEEANLITLVMNQELISRTKKINSLKAMKSAGASLEQLSNIASLYSLENFAQVILKVLNGINNFMIKIAEVLRNIVAAIIKFIKTMFKSDKIYHMGKKLVKEKPDATIHGFKFSKPIRAIVSDGIKSGRNISLIIQRESNNALFEILDDAVGEAKMKDKEAIAKLEGAYTNVENEFKVINDEILSVEIQESEMKISDFLKDDEGLYLVSKSFNADMDTASKLTDALAKGAEAIAKRLAKAQTKYNEVLTKQGADEETKKQFMEGYNKAFGKATGCYKFASQAMNGLTKKLLPLSQKAAKAIQSLSGSGEQTDNNQASSTPATTN